jgi:hypothetical protein
MMIGQADLADFPLTEAEKVSPSIRRRRVHRGNGRSALIVFLSACSILIGSYWFARNLTMFGNPFYPTGLNLGGRNVFSTKVYPGAQTSIRLKSFRKNIVVLVTTKVFDRESAFMAGLPNITGWGWFVFACGLPAILFAALFVRHFVWLMLAFLASLLSLMAWTAADPFNMRATLWLPALAALAFCLMISVLPASRTRACITALAGLCALLNFIGTLTPERFPPRQWAALMQLPVMQRSTAVLGHRIGPTYQAALQIVPPDERIGYNVNFDGWIYPLYDADLSRHLQYVEIDQGESVLDAMIATDVRYLFVSRPRPFVQSALDREVAAGRILQVAAGLYARTDR